MASSLTLLRLRVDRLAEMSRGTIELRYSSANNVWSVWTSQGNLMRLVGGTLSVDPSISVTAAELRWQRRTLDSPF